MQNHPERLTLTVPEAAALLGISKGAAYEGVRRGEIFAVTIGRRILIPRARLEEMLGANGNGSKPGEMATEGVR